MAWQETQKFNFVCNLLAFFSCRQLTRVMFIQTKGGVVAIIWACWKTQKPGLVNHSKIKTKPKKRDNVEVGGIESSREMLWNKQKARLNGGTRKARSSSPGLVDSSVRLQSSSSPPPLPLLPPPPKQLTPLSSSCPYDFHSKLLLSSHLLLWLLPKMRSPGTSSWILEP